MNKFKSLLYSLILLMILAPMAVSCDDNKSYADLLADEDKSVNNFLADQRVINSIPEDSILSYG